MTVYIGSPIFGCYINSERVVTTFNDGTSAILDIADGDNGWYAQIARDHGYGDNWRLYAQHHDIFHNVVWASLFGTPSPVLYYVAHGCPLTWSAKPEEDLISMLQWSLMTGQRGYHAPYLTEHWPGWGEALHSVEFALREGGLLNV